MEVVVGLASHFFVWILLFVAAFLEGDEIVKTNSMEILRNSTVSKNLKKSNP